MCHPSLLLFTCSIFPKHERPQLDTVFQTWSNLGLCTLASIFGNAFCTPRFHLPSCYWLKFLCWTRWSHDQVISWSVIKWPIRSSVKSNWWSPAVQNKSLGLVHKCMTLNFILFFSFHWYYPSPQGHFFFLWYYSTIHLCIDNISQLFAISIFHYYIPTSCAKVRNGNINNNSPCNINSNIFMKSRKIRFVRIPLRKSIGFLLIRENLFLSLKCLINDIMLV